MRWIAAAILFYSVACAHAADLATLTKWGTPEGTVKQQGEFCYAMDGQTRLARWTLESIGVEELAGRATRIDSFAADESIPAEFRASLADYQSSGYDRGHLACAGNYTQQAAKSATFLLSNIAPQNKQLNRGEWRKLEQYCRDRVNATTRVWILTVPIWLADGEHVRTHTIGEHHVWVPTHFGKAVLESVNGKEPFRLFAWIVPNTDPPASLDSFEQWAATVDELEEASGLDLWNKLPAELQTRLESGR